MPKPVVLIDLDGVLFGFDEWIYERRYLWPSLTINPEEQTAYFLTSHVSKRDAAAMRAHVNGSRIFLELEPLPGAVAGLWALAEEADVWLCTRPLEANRYCRDDKAASVRKHFGAEFEKKMILTSDKSLVRGAVLLDDHPKFPEIERAEWRPVVYSQPHNTHEASPHAALPHWSWAEPIERLLAFAEA